MDYPNGFIDHEYRGFRIRYAKDAFETSNTVVSSTITALTSESNAAMALTGGMPPLGWEIAPGDRLQAFLERTHAAIDTMLKTLEDSSVTYDSYRGVDIAVSVNRGRNERWGWTMMVMSERDKAIHSGIADAEEAARSTALDRGRKRVDALLEEGVLVPPTAS